MYLTDLPVFSSLTCTTEPIWTTSVERSLVSITRRHPQLLLQLGDPALEHRLLVLGVVVLGVLGDVAELPRLLDPLGDLATLLGREQLELVLELLQTFWGEDYVLRHLSLDRGVVARGCRADRTALRGGDVAGRRPERAQQYSEPEKARAGHVRVPSCERRRGSLEQLAARPSASPLPAAPPAGRLAVVRSSPRRSTYQG